MHPDPTSPAARRTKAARHRGVYYRELPGGKRRYEITFLDETGRRRWETVDGNLEAAQAVLEERNRHRRSGEAVAPRKMRLAEYADTWLAAQTQLRPRTRALYPGNLRIHVLPRLGWHHLHEIREDDITALIGALRERGLSGYTIRGVLVPLGRILNSAVRRGHIPSNPITRLERGERPAVERREMRILDSAEIGQVLEAADDAYRPAIATAVFTGLRLGELLGLTWADVDFDGGIVRVRRQLDRDGRRVAPKTPQAVREVVLMPSLGRLLRAHKERAFSRGLAKPADPVFASRVGTPLHYRNLSRRGLGGALERAGLGAERVRFHDLRHTFASILIGQGENVVYASRQLGHASPDITLSVYAHLFDRAEHAARASDRLEAAFGNLVETSGGERRRTAGGGEIVDLASGAGSGV